MSSIWTVQCLLCKYQDASWLKGFRTTASRVLFAVFANTVLSSQYWGGCASLVYLVRLWVIWVPSSPSLCMISLPESTFSFQVREHISEEEEQNTWALLMFSGDRAQMLKMQEESDQFSETLRDGSEFHSTLYHMMKDFASPEATEKVRHSNCQFIDSVCYMLLSVRVLSYS